MSEAGVHFDFYRHLQNAIDDSSQRGSRTFERVEPEYNQDIDGRADLVVFDSNDPVLVIEAKRPDGTSGREIDPYSPVVIRQAHGYASELGSPFFATYNGERLVLFNTHEQGVPLLKRSTKSYDVGNVEAFADTLLNEVVRLEAGRTKWDSLDDAFIERVRSLHEQLTPEYLAALSTQLEETDFYESFANWASEQGLKYDDMTQSEQQQTRDRFAEEGAYLVANKLIFYKILESAPAYASEVRPLAIRENHAREDLETFFEEIVTNIDFEAVFEHDDIFSEIPLSRAGKRISEFINELDDQDLTQFDSDVIGRIYEGVIPPERRHDLGEYYTPPAICDLITRLTIRDASDQVLDPACGSGGFPVSTYHRKRDLLAEPAGSHDRLLEEIYGIDINRFPAHLTAINLAIQNLDSHTENVNVEVSNFFNVTPDTARFGRTAASASGEQYEHNITETLGGFDAVIGNPPYIKQQNIKDRARVRDHLSRVDGTHLSKMSDIYSYFITHSAEFLANGGRLGFITSDRWLDTKYGVDLQEFILDNFTAEAVIKFNRQTFEDALIGSCVVILTKEEESTIRNEHTAKFLRINESLDVDEVQSVVEENYGPNQMIRREDLQIVTRRQQDLYEEAKWSVFFNAPPIYFDTLGRKDTVELGEAATITRGITSGANNFYYGRTEEWVDLGLEKYVEPLLKASGQVNKIEFDENAAEEWAYLSIHDLVEKALAEEREEYSDREPAETVKQWLAENGHAILVEYIEWGENQGFPDRQGRDMQGRSIWFDLGEIQSVPIMMTRFTWREHRIIWNEAGAVCTKQFYYVVPNSGINPKVLCAILNSRLTWLMCELKGRWTGGQGMARVELMVYEAEKLPIPDPEQISEERQAQIIESFEQLIERENELGEDVSINATEAERDALDRAVLATVGMEDRLDELKTAVTQSVMMREQAGGENTEVLVDRPTETEVIELAGVTHTRESATLGDFE